MTKGIFKHLFKTGLNEYQMKRYYQDEEGKLLGMEYNRALCDETGAVYDILCGPFFICGLGAEDFTSLSDALADKYCKYFERPELFVRVGGTLMVMRA